MIIGIIDVDYVTGCKTENDTPVGSNRNRPKAFQVALQRMKPKARQIHIIDRGGNIQAR